MNTPFDKYSAKEAAQMLGVDYSTVTGWCNRGIINCDNVGDGPHKNRYSIEENEIRYIKNLIGKYGIRKMLLHYNKNWKETAAEYKPEPVEVQRTFDIYDEEPAKEEVEATSNSDDFNPNKVLNTIVYIRDLKKRLKDLEEEKTQIQSELTRCTKEVMGVIG